MSIEITEKKAEKSEFIIPAVDPFDGYIGFIQNDTGYWQLCANRNFNANKPYCVFDTKQDIQKQAAQEIGMKNGGQLVIFKLG